jgi:putative ABC transport system ATP-binding protein
VAGVTTCPVLAGEDLALTFGGTPALDGATLEVAEGEVVAVMGPSGSGKSTLLYCLAGVLVPDRGHVTFGGARISDLGDRRRSDLRLRSFGFVPQFGDLVPELTLLENVALPLRLLGTGRRDAERRAAELLHDVGVEGAGSRHAGAASGGEAQRAAVARALVHEPAVVFADEPTGALDSVTGELVMEALVGLARQRRSAVVLVTHDAVVASHADREVIVRDGRTPAPDRLLA